LASYSHGGSLHHHLAAGVQLFTGSAIEEFSALISYVGSGMVRYIHDRLAFNRSDSLASLTANVLSAYVTDDASERLL